MTKGSSWANYCPGDNSGHKALVRLLLVVIVLLGEKSGDYNVDYYRLRQLNLLKDWLRSTRATDNK